MRLAKMMVMVSGSVGDELLQRSELHQVKAPQQAQERPPKHGGEAVQRWHVHSGNVPFHGQHQAVEAGLRARALQDGQHVTMAVGSRGPSMQIWAM